jgi:hypothetical protein
MVWKYLIPDKLSGGRTVSEDVFLLPADGEERSVWLTIFGIDYFSSISDSDYLHDLLEEIKDELNSKGYYVKGNELFVNKADFSIGEILDWTKKWLNLSGYDCDNLEKGTLGDFKNRHMVVHALEKEFDIIMSRYSSGN